MCVAHTRALFLGRRALFKPLLNVAPFFRRRKTMKERYFALGIHRFDFVGEKAVPLAQVTLTLLSMLQVSSIKILLLTVLLC